MNEAIRDLFVYFVVERNPRHPGIPPCDGILVTPMVRDGDVVRGASVDDLGDGIVDPRAELNPPLRTLEVPSRQLANTQEPWHPQTLASFSFRVKAGVALGG